MAIQKVRTFQYRPSRKRQEQLGRDDWRRIELPRAGGGDGRSPGSSNLIRLIIMLVAILGIGIAMMALR